MCLFILCGYIISMAESKPSSATVIVVREHMSFTTLLCAILIMFLGLGLSSMLGSMGADNRMSKIVMIASVCLSIVIIFGSFYNYSKFGESDADILDASFFYGFASFLTLLLCGFILFVSIMALRSGSK